MELTEKVKEDFCDNFCKMPKEWQGEQNELTSWCNEHCPFWKDIVRWDKVKKGTVIVVDFAHDGGWQDEQIRVFDHYNEADDTVYYIWDSCVKGDVVSADANRCRLYKGGES